MFSLCDMYLHISSCLSGRQLFLHKVLFTSDKVSDVVQLNLFVHLSVSMTAIIIVDGSH